jgi:hypothetical protein
VSLQRIKKRKLATWTATTLSVVSLALAPVFVPAMAANMRKNIALVAKSGLDIFTPAGVDIKLAIKREQLALVNRSASRFPFTPAGIELPQSRTMTVAARSTAPIVVRAVSVRNIMATLQPGTGNASTLHASDFHLTALRGWQGFALNTAPKLTPAKPLIEIGKTGFKLDDIAKPKPSRFNTAVKIASKEGVSANQRNAVASGDYSLDLGTSFSISKRVAVTAGVAYKSERDRIAPTQDNVKDSEAVYVGTKIRF